MPTTFPPVPEQIKSINHYLKLAEDHDDRNPIVCYYARMFAFEQCLKIIPGSKPPEVVKFLTALMSHLEDFKKKHADVEGIANETIAQALLEEYVEKLHFYALREDDNEQFHKNMIKAFYTVGVLCDILSHFGELDDDMSGKRIFSKQRAAYLHNCLKNGTQPISSKTVILSSEEAKHDRTFIPKEEIDAEDERAAAEAASAGSDREDENAASDDDDELTKWAAKMTSDYKKMVAGTLNPTAGPVDINNLPAVPQFDPIPSPAQPVPRPQVRVTVPPVTPQPVASTSSVDATQMDKAQKYCKWATSALNYEDVSTAILNLEKALHLLKTGTEME